MVNLDQCYFLLFANMPASHVNELETIRGARFELQFFALVLLRPWSWQSSGCLHVQTSTASSS